MPVHPQGRDITCTPAKTNQKRIGGKTRKVPYKDETKRCEYDKTFKQKRCSEGWTKKGVDMRLTEIEVETAQDARPAQRGRRRARRVSVRSHLWRGPRLPLAGSAAVRDTHRNLLPT